jgi:hypothetical protein
MGTACRGHGQCSKEQRSGSEVHVSPQDSHRWGKMLAHISRVGVCEASQGEGPGPPGSDIPSPREPLTGLGTSTQRPVKGVNATENVTKKNHGGIRRPA